MRRYRHPILLLLMAVLLPSCAAPAGTGGAPAEELLEITEPMASIREDIESAREHVLDPVEAEAALARARGTLAHAETLVDAYAVEAEDDPLVARGYALIEAQRLELDTAATDVVRASLEPVADGPVHATALTFATSVLVAREVAPEPTCTHSPKPTISRIWASSSSARLRVRFDCDVVDEWRLYRRVPAPPYVWWPYREIGSGTSTYGSVIDRDLEYDTEYCYWAIAGNSYGSAAAEEFCLRTQVRPEPPAAPTGLEVVTNNAESTLLRWRDGSDNEAGFAITRATASSFGQPIPAGERHYAYAGFEETFTPSEMGNEAWRDDAEPLESDSLYCYYVYAQNAWGGSDAIHGCGWTGLAEPTAPTFTNMDVDDDRIRFRAHSNRMAYMRVNMYRAGDYLGQRDFERRSGYDYATVDWGGLDDGVEYCFTAIPHNRPRSADHDVRDVWGPRTTVCRTTDAGTSVFSNTIYLRRQPIVSGPIPYTVSWPSFGVLNATLLELSVPDNGLSDLYVRFLKPGRSSSECNDASAVVSVRDGSTLTAAEMTALFGSATPHTPLNIVACLGGPGSTPLRDQTPLNITYRRD